MSPLDDELRTLLASRAEQVTPAPDPLAGIEQRARRMRRNRVAGAALASVIVLAGAGLAVPSLLPDRDSGATQFGTGQPGSGDDAPRAYRLDPADPWPYRGDPAALGGGMLTTTQSVWSTRHPGSTLTPLFGQVYEPSGQSEIAFVASGDGRTRWGYATSSESGPSFFVDDTIETKPAVLMAALPGDEGPRLFVLAAPNAGELGYAKDYQSFQTLVGTAPGVAYAPLEGDTTNAAVRVLDADGNLDKPVFLGPAPSAGSVSPPTAPVNVLDWAPRGETPDPATLDRATTAFAQADGKTGDAFTRVLFAGRTSDGRPYVYFQAWKGSQQARLAGYESDGRGGGTPFYGPEIGPDPTILGYVVTNGPSKELLVLVPRPGVGQVSYSPDDTTAFRVVANGRSDTNPVGLVDRDPRATNDRYEVNAADASLLQRGSVMTLLCGASGCG